MRNKQLFILLCAACIMPLHAAVWRTHYAYNNVTQIAMSNEEVYAISDGSLFSVNKQTEQIKVYNNQSGLHSTGINCIHYDSIGEQLIIGYETGKIDLLHKQGVQYIGELYNKDMTQRKTIHNITLHGRTAYLSTAYGVQTMDLRQNKLVDSYWLRPGGEETAVRDVLIAKDSIFAFTDDSLYSAALSSALEDYSVWTREVAGRVSPDPEKGVHYQDATDHWYKGHTEGIVRYTPTERVTYKPQGPYNNNPYFIAAVGEQVFMLNGGRWTSQYFHPGHVIRYRDKSWRTIVADTIAAQSGSSYVYDFMNVAVDPLDANHYVISSYGTGLYEFRGDSCVNHTLANGIIQSAIAGDPGRYTRLNGAQFDSIGRLWMLNADKVDYPLIMRDSSGYHGIPLVVNSMPISIDIPGDLVIDRTNARYKWICASYKTAGLYLLDDGGTPTDLTDDRCIGRTTWTNRDGRVFEPANIYHIMQDDLNRIWLITEQGAAYIDANTDFFSSDAIVQPEVTDSNGENPLTSQRIEAICQSADGHLWFGSQSLGVYETDENATTIIAHYTSDNSAMSSNAILSLAAGADGHVWIGTADGLVEYDPNGSAEGLVSMAEAEEPLDPGMMLQWRLHLSYSNAQEIAASKQRIFALANGSLFSVNRTDEQIEYWSKANGLSGTTIAHIAYDGASQRLIVAYANGQIDLIDAEGTVIAMPDISMKAGSIDVSIHSIHVGQPYSYLAMPFGIIVIDTQKGEVSETYYIGPNAAAIDIQQVVQLHDSLYAFSYDTLYCAALHENIVDYSYWHRIALPFEQADQALVHQQQLYVLSQDTLYQRQGTQWKRIATNMAWIHVNNDQLLAYQTGTGLVRLNDAGQWEGLSNRYIAADATYSNGEYWLAEEGQGLVRLGTSGDDFFRAEGPMSNFGYHLDIAHDQLYVSPGGRWAEQYARHSSLSIYNGQQWQGIPWQDTWYYTDHDIRDAVQIAVDPNDAGHFFVATYGTGLFEFKDYKAVAHYDSNNSPLRRTNDDVSDYYYTRTDGVTMDEEGNVWVLNSTAIGNPIHILTPTGQWFSLSAKNTFFSTPAGIWIDQRDSHRKWMIDQRNTQKVVLLDDKGTPLYGDDDRCISRSSFVDQNSNVLSPTQFRCLAQDQSNRIWIGTDKGIIVIPKDVDLFTSNACRRIIIPRNDGTNLGDYLLGDEQINCLAVDGGNRMWIGTANSGLYLIEDDTITVAHFTQTNSLLPSNSVQSIAIMPKTGEVFVGTDNGIASYRSDASEAQENMSSAYAFPNPVRPDYGGNISICGLMDNTVVNIIDAGGNLVCKTKSHGGTAVWDGKLPDGRRATPGIYTALCNATSGHTVVKIMVIR